jgi:hypothetical protein
VNELAGFTPRERMSLYFLLRDRKLINKITSVKFLPNTV